jgi:hypothetical protein
MTIESYAARLKFLQHSFHVLVEYAETLSPTREMDDLYYFLRFPGFCTIWPQTPKTNRPEQIRIHLRGLCRSFELSSNLSLRTINWSYSSCVVRDVSQVPDALRYLQQAARNRDSGPRR